MASDAPEREGLDQLAEVALTLNDSLLNADSIVDERVVTSTRDQYASKMRFMARFFRDNAMLDALDESGALRFPMSLEHVKAFLGFISADNPDGSMKAASTTFGYVSALKFYWRERHSIPHDVDNYLKRFINGYKRRIAQKKELGLMKNYEGKVPVTISIYACLCRFALRIFRSAAGAFVHLYLILCWNLFAR